VELIERCGNDTIELFGDTGTGKTTFVLKVLEELPAEKKLYIDTERNLLKEPEFAEYKYIPDFQELYHYIMHLPDGYKAVVIDSVGLPILGEFATMRLDEKGQILLKMEAISYALKRYSYKNDAVVIVTNQPESEFGKEKGHILRPFGDKSKYYYKEIWKSELMYSSPTKTVCNIKSFRSRFFGRDAPLYRLTVTSNDVKLERLYSDKDDINKS